MPFFLCPEQPHGRGGLGLQGRRGTQVLLAHISDAIWPFQQPAVWESLRKRVWMRCNASFFLNWKTKRKRRCGCFGRDSYARLRLPQYGSEAPTGEAVQVIQKAWEKARGGNLTAKCLND